jgi:hypothetical protein
MLSIRTKLTFRVAYKPLFDVSQASHIALGLFQGAHYLCAAVKDGIVLLRYNFYAQSFEHMIVLIPVFPYSFLISH